MIEIDKKRILITHKPMIPENNIDILIYGHTHKPEIKHGQRANEPKLIINPGEASGWLFNKPTIAILDLKTVDAEIIPL